MTKKLKIAATGTITDKWVDVTPGRAGYYESAVKVAGADWESGAVLSQSNYKAAISAPDIAKRFVGGIKNAGAAKYERKAGTLGKDRFGPGVSAAKEDFNTGFAPYRDVIEGLEVPDRKPRGDPSNYEIGKKVGDALFKKRIALLGATA